MYDLGDFDECLNIDEPDQFIPRYCLARLSREELVMPSELIHHNFKSLTDFAKLKRPQPRIVPTKSNMLGLSFGICVPKSCSKENMEHLFATIQKKILKDKALLTIVPNTCQVNEDRNWNLNVADSAVLAFIAFMAFIMISSTIYDIYQTRRDREKDCIFIAFSMYTNGRKLFACKTSSCEHSIECLTGIRVLSALWVIYAHANVMTMLAPVVNFAYIPEYVSKYSTIVLLLAPFSVDSFLFLSGLLITWSMLKHLNKTNGKANYVMIYVHRYLRLTPIMGIVILISLTLFKKIGSGPLWYSYILHAINCDKYWWSSLLYIQNYYNADAICLSHTWYLSVDMQLFLFAPLIGYLLYRGGYIAVALIAALVGICVGWTFWLYKAFELINQVLNITNDIQETFMLTYYPTHVRMSPWLIGTVFAYLLFKMNGRRQKWHIVRVIVHWVLTAAIFGVLAYFSYELQQMDHKANSTESGIYTASSRVGWSIFLCMVVYACVCGYGGPINWFLSLPMWQPFARLSYAIYLLHMPIMLATAASTHTPLYFSGRNILFKFFGDFIAALLLSIIVSLAFESPIIVLEKILFGSKKKSNLMPLSERQQSTAPRISHTR
ncbi:nose resistant to fluoxetine protein 6-like isoform X2 [Contarinia nasturtii]|nr:nose resistant to fluoxetine protein 6-like isoform X2 [Contarinia nasturtii]